MSKPTKGIWGKDNWDFSRFLLLLCALVVLALCLGPPGQSEPVAQFVVPGPAFGHPMASMPVGVSVTPAVYITGRLAPLPLAIEAMTIYNRYMRAEIPVALPPARAVTEPHAAPFLKVWRYDGSRASPVRLDRHFNLKRVLRA